MSRDGLERVARDLRGESRWDEPMSRHTALKVGGPADLFIEPADLLDLKEALENLAAAEIPCQVVGAGFNLLVRDGGVRGCVITLRGFDRLKPLPGGRLEVGAGVTNAMLCTVAAESCLSGVEFLCGIPGSVGGALVMNAGAHGSEILQRADSLTTLCGGETAVRRGEDLDYGYRYLKLRPGEIVVGATLSLESAERQEIESRMAGYHAARGGSQRVGYPSAGSFFKNPIGVQAWSLIDRAGLRGLSVGGAQVSEVHANFLVNRGGAKANDFLGLAAMVKGRVLEMSGIELEEEVRVIGEG